MSIAPGSGVEQDTVRDLLAQKQVLLMELKHYENNNRVNDEIEKRDENLEHGNVIPANTRLQIAISTNDSNNESVSYYLNKYLSNTYYTTTTTTITPNKKILTELCGNLHNYQQSYNYQSCHRVRRRDIQRRDTRGPPTSKSLVVRGARASPSAEG